MFALIASAALLAADIPPASTADTQQAYQDAKAAAGRTPDDQVKLAYWCEAHGLTPERLKHLAQAVLADPNHATARGLLGLVSRQDRWMRPDAVASQVQADPALAATLAEYDTKRSATPYTADGQMSLAQWAEERGLKEQAKAHLTAVVRLDPKREAAWKKLGYKKHDGQWATDADVAAAKADADAQKAADKKWKPLLEKWKAQLARPSQRDEAEASLLAVTDSRAVRPIEQAFLSGSNANEAVALRTLGQIDSAMASRLIMMLAVKGSTPATRRVAVEMLRQRDPREFAGLLINSLRDRVEYQIQPVAGPGSTGKLLIKDPKKKVQRLYSTPTVPNYLSWLTQVADGAPTVNFSSQTQIGGRDRVISDQNMSYNEFLKYRPADPLLVKHVQDEQANAPNVLRDFLAVPNHPHNRQAYHDNPTNYKNNTFGFDVQNHQITTLSIGTETTVPVAAMIAEYQKTAYFAQQQLARDVAILDQYNRQVDEFNDRLTLPLRNISGEDHGADIPAWTGWLVSVNGYSMISQSQTDVPTYTVGVPLAYQPQTGLISSTSSLIGTNSQVQVVSPTSKIVSCFGAGTLVQTLTGPRAIELLQVGDLVLTQSVATGKLGYHPIMILHHNPPSPTFLIKLAGDTIVSSPFHRFWKVGQGWVMARDIREGDRLRLLSGTALVEEYKAGDVQRVYNLDIAEDADFFAGASAALVHDNTLPDPRLVPFDLPVVDAKAVAIK